MKIRLDYLVAVVSLAFWLTAGWVVIDYNLGLGSTTLRWPNPAHPTAAWSWDAKEATPTVLEPKSGQWLRVTLPRGFVDGTLQVQTKQSVILQLEAEPRVGQAEITSVSAGTIHRLSFRWTQLVARGRTFRFRLENPNEAAVIISHVTLQTTR